LPARLPFIRNPHGFRSYEIARLSKIDPSVPPNLFTISEVDKLYEAARGAGIYAVVSKARAWDLIGTIESSIAHLSSLGQPIQ